MLEYNLKLLKKLKIQVKILFKKGMPCSILLCETSCNKLLLVEVMIEDMNIEKQ